MKNFQYRPLNQEELDLCQSFRKSHGFDPKRTISSCGLGWFREYIEKATGMDKESAGRLAMLVKLREDPKTMIMLHFLQAKGGSAELKTCVSYMSDTLRISEQQAQTFVISAAGGMVNSIATYDTDSEGKLKVRLLENGEETPLNLSYS